MHCRNPAARQPAETYQTPNPLYDHSKVNRRAGFRQNQGAVNRRVFFKHGILDFTSNPALVEWHKKATGTLKSHCRNDRRLRGVGQDEIVFQSYATQLQSP